MYIPTVIKKLFNSDVVNFQLKKILKSSTKLVEAIDKYGIKEIILNN